MEAAFEAGWKFRLQTLPSPDIRSGGEGRREESLKLVNTQSDPPQRASTATLALPEVTSHTPRL